MSSITLQDNCPITKAATRNIGIQTSHSREINKTEHPRKRDIRYIASVTENFYLTRSQAREIVAKYRDLDWDSL